MSHNNEATSCWEKYFSKTHQTDYWFNAATGEKSWVDPSLQKSLQIGSNSSSQQSAIEPVSGYFSSSLGKRPRSDEVDQISSITQNQNRISNKIAIIVPFRDLHEEQQRKKHLEQFIPYITEFLSEINVKTQSSTKTSSRTFTIYIIQQSDDNRKFNRGKLLNIGYDIAKKDQCDIFIFHDVDLLPSRELLKYYCTMPQTNPIHIARVWNRYNNNPSYFGGIVAFNSAMFESINGFPNSFWGWGGEDDEMYRRVKAVGYTPEAPDVNQGGSITDLEDMSLDKKLGFLRTHKLWKCMNKMEVLDENKNNKGQNGLTDLHYQILKNETFMSNRIDNTNINSDSNSVVLSNAASVSTSSDSAYMITVDVELNNHWTDLVCGVGDDQMSATVEELKIRYNNNISKTKKSMV